MKLKRFKLGKRNRIALVAFVLFPLVAYIWIYKPRRSPEITFVSAEQIGHRIYMKFRVKNRSILPIFLNVDFEDVPKIWLFSKQSGELVGSDFVGFEPEPLGTFRDDGWRRLERGARLDVAVSIHRDDGHEPFYGQLWWSPTVDPYNTIGTKIGAAFYQMGGQHEAIHSLSTYFDGRGGIQSVFTPSLAQAVELISGKRDSPLREEIRQFLDQETPALFQDLRLRPAFQAMESYARGEMEVLSVERAMD